MDALTTLSGMEHVTSVGSIGLAVSSMDSLQSLQGAQNITAVAGSLQLSSNPLLANLLGLEAVTSVDYLVIQNNQNLQTLAGLDSLTTERGRVADHARVIPGRGRSMVAGGAWHRPRVGPSGPR